MKIIVIADGRAQTEFRDKGIREGISLQFEADASDLKQADACFYLLPEEKLKEDLPNLQKLTSPVFVNAVQNTIDQLGAHFIRINAWPGFLLNPVLELAASPAIQPGAEKILETLGWKYQWVPDIPGMITPRTIAMIINEAYFAVEDEVSSREDIDTAMKLGTNYPHGPFEWSEKIGLSNIYNLLVALAAKDTRYTPAGLLSQEAKL